MWMLIIVLLLLYCGGSLGVFWLVCDLFGWGFSFPTIVGLWFLGHVIAAVIRGKIK